MHPLPSRTYDSEQSTRCPSLNKQCSSAIIISTTVICRMKYPNRRPRELQFRVTSVGSLAVSFEVSDWTTTYVVAVRDGGVLCGRCDFSCYVCGKCRRRHQTTVVALIIAMPAFDSPRRRPRRSAAEMCGRRTHPPADADPQEFLRSAD